MKCKTADYSRTSDLSGLKKSPKLKGEHHLRRNSQVTLDTAMNDFNSGQFKPRMKNMAVQVNFYLYLNAVLPPELFGAWELAHICPYLSSQLSLESSGGGRVDIVGVSSALYIKDFNM